MFLLKFLTILILALVTKAQTCYYDGEVPYPGLYEITFANNGPMCVEYYFGTGEIKVLSAALSNVQINCASANIVIRDQNRNVVLDFCSNSLTAAKLTARYFIVQLIIKTYGSFYSQIRFDSSSVTYSSSTTPSTTTYAPPSTTTKSTTLMTTVPSTTRLSSSTISSISTTTKTSTIECGISANPYNGTLNRIVNGEPAQANAWPWQVFLYSGGFMCGGSLINNQWIVTAAHCITGESVEAYLGYRDISRAYNGRRVSKVIGHPLYNEDTIKNDIALYKLETPVTFSDSIRPICLPTTFNGGANKLSVVTGWGKTGDDQGTANVLQQVVIPFIDNNICNSYFGNLNFTTQFCAGQTSGTVRDSCQGDSGGPLHTKEGDKFVLSGVVSFGGSSCNGFGVYTNVLAYKDWIAQTIANN